MGSIINFRAARTLPALLALTASLALAAPVAAQYRGGSGSYGSQDWERRAYDNGYQRGLQQGERDVRDRRAYRLDQDDYRRGDRGYDRRTSDLARYRDVFRRGYEAGYRDGYYPNQNGRWGGAVPRGRYPDQYPGGYPDNRYPDNRYPNSRYPDSRRGGYYGSPAATAGYNTGYNDGYEKGLEDGRDRDRFDPTRQSRYRSADHGYNSRYGSKDLYKQGYREGFREGYERGYYDVGYNGNNRNNRNSRGGWWPF
jgi:hypothetical protein